MNLVPTVKKCIDVRPGLARAKKSKQVHTEKGTMQHVVGYSCPEKGTMQHVVGYSCPIANHSG
jgi:hypothetical protein